MTTERQSFSPAEIARANRISRTRVMALIHAGALRAANIGTKTRPRFRITTDAMREFFEAREAKRLVKTTRRATPRETAPAKEWF